MSGSMWLASYCCREKSVVDSECRERGSPRTAPAFGPGWGVGWREGVDPAPGRCPWSKVLFVSKLTAVCDGGFGGVSVCKRGADFFGNRKREVEAEGTVVAGPFW